MDKAMKCVLDARGAVKQDVEKRLSEFSALGRKGDKELFKELCFCIMTANFTAERGWKIQKSIGDGLLTLPEKRLAARLRTEGHRFPNMRAKYIVEARQHLPGLKKKLKGFESSGDMHGMREWLVKSVKGLGYKEASHFLRNIGYGDFAIIDFHIVDFMERVAGVPRPKTITPKNYVQLESELLKIGDRMGMDMAELDLYMWYCETGKVLK